MEEIDLNTESLLNDSNLRQKQKTYDFLDMDIVMQEVFIRHLLLDI